MPGFVPETRGVVTELFIKKDGRDFRSFLGAATAKSMKVGNA